MCRGFIRGAVNELWPRLEGHKYRWELDSYGLPEGYDKLVVADVTSGHLHADCRTAELSSGSVCAVEILGPKWGQTRGPGAPARSIGCL